MQYEVPIELVGLYVFCQVNRYYPVGERNTAAVDTLDNICRQADIALGDVYGVFHNSGKTI